MDYREIQRKYFPEDFSSSRKTFIHNLSYDFATPLLLVG